MNDSVPWVLHTLHTIVRDSLQVKYMFCEGNQYFTSSNLSLYLIKPTNWFLQVFLISVFLKTVYVAQF